VVSDGASDGDLTSELAEEIRSAVAEASPAAPPRPAAATGLEDDEEVRVRLARALEHATPAIPPAVRFSGSKKFLVRALRFLWRDQATFNALLLEAAGALAERSRQTAVRLGEVRSELDDSRAALAHLHAAQDERVKKWNAGWERRGSIQDGRLAMLEAGGPVPPAETPRPAAAQHLPPGVYSLFEERFRGSP
jgi:hypothetical protein